MDGVSRAVGTCETMCPTEEFQMRQREGLLHSLELPHGRKPVGRGRARVRGEISCAVKEYSRPAAGRADPDPNTLRPPRVLHQTIHYLFNNLISKQHSQEPGWNVIYDFVFDRLRAIRQDMVIQGISGQDAIIILEACVRFHVYAAYRLCEHKMDTFDPIINFQHTQECLKRLLYLYKQTDSRQMESTDNDSNTTDRRHNRPCTCANSDSTKTRTNHNDRLGSSGSVSDSIENRLRDMHVSEGSRQHGESHTDSDADNDRDTSDDCDGRMGWKSQTCLVDCCSCSKVSHRNRAEFESVYLLCNLGDSDALRHFLNLPKTIRSDCVPSLAYKMSISYLLGNTLHVERLASRLPSVLALCAFHRHLASVQMHGLRIMCAAHSSKNTRYPVGKLTQLLAFDSETATKQACSDSGLEVKDGKVSFLKSAFKSQEKACAACSAKIAWKQVRHGPLPRPSSRYERRKPMACAACCAKIAWKQVRHGPLPRPSSCYERRKPMTIPVRWEFLEGKLSSVCLSDLLLGQAVGC